METTPTAAPTVSTQQAPRDGHNNTTQSYAYNVENKTKPKTPKKKTGEDKQPHKRQRSLNDSQISPCKSTSPRSHRISDMDIEHRLYELLEQTTAHQDVDLVDSYMRASMQPPITHESLSELDITRIINNPKLRHDVNFDRELHFRPNLDGSRGKHKLKAADEYWKALIGELELYRACGAQLVTCDTSDKLAYWSRMMNTSQKRMPIMFDTIREVIKTLVPEKDQPTVAERLDVSMIMQEISKGVFDMMSLAEWLSRLLKAHCAPMRDEWIDQMVAQTQRGMNEGCQKRIVLGLRQLLGILEAMKLVSQL